MPKKATLTIQIKGDKSNLDKVLKGASVGVVAFGNLAARGMEKALTASVDFAKSLADGVKDAYDLGSAMIDLNAKTGIAVDQLLVLQQAGKDAGLDDVTGAVNKMQKALVDAVQNGTGPAAKAFAMLSLRAEDLVKKSPVEQLEAIGEAMRKIKSPELKTDIARNLFGKSGPELQSLLGNPNAMKEAAASIGSQARILKENAQAFDDVSDRLNRSGVKLQGFFVGVAAGVLPQMDAATKKFDQIDLAEQGVKFGKAIGEAMDKLGNTFKGLQLDNIADTFLAKIKEAARVVSFIGKMNSFFRGDAGPIVDQFKKGAAPIGRTDENKPESKTDRKYSISPPSSFFKNPDPRISKGPVNPFGRGIDKAAMRKAEYEALVKRFGMAAVDKMSMESINSRPVAHSAALSSSGLTTGRLTSGGLDGKAYGQTPILSSRDRRRAQDIAVANGADPDARKSNANAFHVIRSGDKRRAENIARQKAKDEESLKGVNAKLTGILEATAATAGALTE